MKHLTLLIGQTFENRSAIRSKPAKRISFDVAASKVVSRGELGRAHLPTPMPVLVDQLVASDREQQRNEPILVSEERVDASEGSEEDLVRNAIGVVTPLRPGERHDLPGKSVPQPLEAG